MAFLKKYCQDMKHGWPVLKVVDRIATKVELEIS